MKIICHTFVENSENFAFGESPDFAVIDVSLDVVAEARRMVLALRSANEIAGATLVSKAAKHAPSYFGEGDFHSDDESEDAIEERLEEIADHSDWQAVPAKLTLPTEGRATQSNRIECSLNAFTDGTAAIRWICEPKHCDGTSVRTQYLSLDQLQAFA